MTPTPTSVTAPIWAITSSSENSRLAISTWISSAERTFSVPVESCAAAASLGVESHPRRRSR
jgi:hypothetical protein